MRRGEETLSIMRGGEECKQEESRRERAIKHVENINEKQEEKYIRKLKEKIRAMKEK